MEQVGSRQARFQILELIAFAGGPGADLQPVALEQTLPQDAWTPGAVALAPQSFAPRPSGDGASSGGFQQQQTAADWFQVQMAAMNAAAPVSTSQWVPPIVEGHGLVSRPDYANLATMQAPQGTGIVQIGDSLPKMAKRLLGDESRWPEIFYLNRDQISDAEIILPGMILRLPEGAKPANPPAPPAYSPVPVPLQPALPGGDAEALRSVTPEQLAHLGATDKAKFFAVLKPAAVASEAKWGVPWQVTLAQIALESGWAKHSIAGYNVFGIKGTGPAGTISMSTKEWRNGQYVTERANFAKYHDYFEAIEMHGKLFHNGYYKKAVSQFQQDRDPVAFTHNIHGIYATSPTYAQNLLTIMRQYHLI